MYGGRTEIASCRYIASVYLPLCQSTAESDRREGRWAPSRASACRKLSSALPLLPERRQKVPYACQMSGCVSSISLHARRQSAQLTQ